MATLNWIQSHSELIMIIIVFFTAIAAFWSASSAKKAASETRKATQASLIADISNYYSSSEMLDAMHLLDGFKSHHRENYADEFRNLRKRDYDSIRTIDHARRRVSHHFAKIHVLRELDLLDDNVVKKIATKGQVEYLRTVVEPLEAALNADYDRSAFESLGNLYNIGPVPLPMAKPECKQENNDCDKG